MSKITGEQDVVATARKDRSEGKRMLKSELRKRGIIATDNSIRIADTSRLDGMFNTLARGLKKACEIQAELKNRNEG